MDWKRFLGILVRKKATTGKRAYMVPSDWRHIFCPHCDGKIPTHDVLLALRPEPKGLSTTFLVKDLDGRMGLINERDYNPVYMRIAEPGEYSDVPIENWSWPFNWSVR